jgi:hypothetical protein
MGVIMKLDFKKAYNRVHWNFLAEVLDHLQQICASASANSEYEVGERRKQCSKKVRLPAERGSPRAFCPSS